VTEPELTEGTLLGGRLRHAQPRQGHRTGLEPVLLAAAMAARPGQRVLEGGTGSGAALLCLAARIPGIIGLGLERDPAMAALARANIAANALPGLAIETTDLTTWAADAPYDHAFANPPWHDEAATPSPHAGKDAARRATPELIAAWARSLAGALRPRGTLTLILGADHLATGLAALAEAGCGSPALFPFWPKPGRPARLVLLRAIRGGRGPARLLPGLTLHQPDGRFTPEADAILRDGAPLPA
jgi:tRNA1(Val) A37 N6-methylase TrmN6